MPQIWDLIVIGGGSGGLTASMMAARLGAKVLLVDKTRLGGDCLHTGCVPSKALLSVARRAHEARGAAALGISTGPVTVDFGAAMAHLRTSRAAIELHETPEALREAGVEVAFGGARFLDARRIQIGGESGDAAGSPARIETARAFIIATGAMPVRPEISGLAQVGCLDHTQIFDLTALPARLIVLGGGPIGCELGQAFSRLGAAVTLIQRNERLVPRETEAASELLRLSLEAEGIEVLTGAAPERIEAGPRVVLPDRTVTGDALLVAIGRRAEVGGLGLEAAGVRCTSKGIAVDGALRTSQRHIYAVGDCVGGPQFTHLAELEARVATRNALFRGTQQRSLAAVPRVTFTEPEIASVGVRSEDAPADARRFRVTLDHVDRFVCEGATAGFAEAVVDAKGRILGATVVGAHAGEVLSGFTIAMTRGMTLPQLGAVVHPYPTFSRAVRRVADAYFMATGVPVWKRRLFGRY